MDSFDNNNTNDELSFTTRKKKAKKTTTLNFDNYTSIDINNQDDNNSNFSNILATVLKKTTENNNTDPDDTIDFNIDRDVLLDGINTSKNNIIQSIPVVIARNDVISMKIHQQKELYKQERLKAEYGINYTPILYYDRYVQQEKRKEQLEQRKLGNGSDNIYKNRLKNDDGTYNEDEVKKQYFQQKGADLHIYQAMGDSLDVMADIIQKKGRTDGSTASFQPAVHNTKAVTTLSTGIAEVQLGIDAKIAALERTEKAKEGLVLQTLHERGLTNTNNNNHYNNGNNRDRDRNYNVNSNDNLDVNSILKDKTVLKDFKDKAGTRTDNVKFREHVKNQRK